MLPADTFKGSFKNLISDAEKIRVEEIITVRIAKLKIFNLFFNIKKARSLFQDVLFLLRFFVLRYFFGRIGKGQQRNSETAQQGIVLYFSVTLLFYFFFSKFSGFAY